MRQTATQEELADKVGDEPAAPLRRHESLQIQCVGDLRRRPAFVA
jgi:hypothetical protein